MAYIQTVSDDEAAGPLLRFFQQAVQRAGRVFQILRVQSVEPHVLRASTALYVALVHDDGALDRFTREAIAVVVSKTNGCHY